MPALKALRAAHPQARIEILGYPHIATIADKRFYADAVRSIEYGALSRFFARDAELPLDLRDYFGGFELILSYLYDPDQIFENNLRRCGAQKILPGPAKIIPGTHAARQLSQPVQELGINVSDLAAKIFPSEKDREFARRFLENCESPMLALHPGSGSERKNWSIENWIELAKTLLNAKALFRTVIFVSGEADEEEMGGCERCLSMNRKSAFRPRAAFAPTGGIARAIDFSRTRFRNFSSRGRRWSALPDFIGLDPTGFGRHKIRT